MEVNAGALLAGSRLVELNVLVKLLGLLGDLGRVVLASLGLFNLLGKGKELELEDLVLYLADLEGRTGLGLGTAGRLDGFVEASGLGLGVLDRLTCGLDNGEVGVGDGG